MDILEAYLLEMQRKGISRRTYDCYYSTLTRFFQDTYKKIPNKSEIKATDMRDWLELKEDIRPATYNTEATKFRSFCNVMKIKYKKETLSYRKIREADRKDSQEYLSHDQVLEVIKNASTLRVATEVAIMYSTGLRRAELCSLKHSNIMHNPPFLKGVKRKGGKVADVYFIEEIGYKKLKDYLTMKSAAKMPCGPDDYIFISRLGKKITPWQVYYDIIHAVKVLEDVKSISPHTFRHSFAYRAVEKGIPLETVSFQMSHANIGITHDIYAHYNSKIQQKRLLGGGDNNIPMATATTTANTGYLKCPICGFGKILEHYILCPVCDSKLKNSCSNCGEKFETDWKKCPSCGKIADEILLEEDKK